MAAQPDSADIPKERKRSQHPAFLAEMRAVAQLISKEMQLQKLSKTEMAKLMGTSRAQLNRILDPESASLTVKSLERAADVLGFQLQYSIVRREELPTTVS